MKQPRLDSMRYPGGLSKALTFSYDDGVLQDRRLVAILNKNGLKGTFNLNSGFFATIDKEGFGGKVDLSRVLPEEIPTLYAGHEVSGHCLYHASPNGMGTAAVLYEMIEDRRRIEQYSGKLVRGFAYPFGAFDEKAKELLKLCGFEYARTIVSTGAFTLPTDFYEWNATAHHDDKNLMGLAKEFCENRRFTFMPELFYLWGHAYEFDMNDNWNVIEDFAAYVAQFKDTVWFATNIEICDYVKAFGQLIYSADGSRIYNPTATKLWLANRGDLYEIEPGATVTIKE